MSQSPEFPRGRAESTPNHYGIASAPKIDGAGRSLTVSVDPRLPSSPPPDGYDVLVFPQDMETDIVVDHPIYNVPPQAKPSPILKTSGSQKKQTHTTTTNEVPGYVYMERKNEDLSDASYLPMQPLEPKNEPNTGPSSDKVFTQLPFLQNNRARTHTLPAKPPEKPQQKGTENLPPRDQGVFNEIPEVKSKALNDTEGNNVLGLLDFQPK